MKMNNLLTIDRQHPQTSALSRAAKILQDGGLVAFPTETVYGLGANALDPEAVKKIFIAKGRPSDNPLIVHVAKIADVEKLAQRITPTARMLMKKFWPGPLTLVLKKRPIVPKEVTGGTGTVAVRMPAHPVALALIRAAQIPVAAPSANLSGKPSPTDAAHVVEDFGGRIDLILDGGKTRVGLESTVIDATGKTISILRNGQITAEKLAKVLGYTPKIAASHKDKKGKIKSPAEVRSPGMKYRHYAPAVPLYLIENSDLDVAEVQLDLMRKKIVKFAKNGQRVGVLCSLENEKLYRKLAGVHQVVVCGSAKNPASIARGLFASLRKFHTANVDVIVAESFPRKGIGHAIMDRLGRAAEKDDKIGRR